MNNWINYHHLYYFKTIAESGTVSAAAKKLRLGQPTLSSQLKTFEATLGVPLFERRHKKLQLTEQGRVALEYAQTIFKLGGELVETLHDRLLPARPVLSVGSLDAIPKQLGYQLVRAALKVANCRISLVEGRGDELLRELLGHRIDLLLTNFLPSGPERRDLIHREISSQSVSLYGVPRFKSLRQKFPASVAGQPLILPTYDSKLRYDLEHWAQLNQVPMDVAFESQDIAMKKLLAGHGLGLLPASRRTVARQLREGTLVEIGPLKGIEEKFHLVGARRKMENPVASALLRSFRI